MAACGRPARVCLVAAAFGLGVLIANLQIKEISWVSRLRLQSLLPPDLGALIAPEGQQLAGTPAARPPEAARGAAGEPGAAVASAPVPEAAASPGGGGGSRGAQAPRAPDPRPLQGRPGGDAAKPAAAPLDAIEPTSTATVTTSLVQLLLGGQAADAKGSVARPSPQKLAPRRSKRPRAQPARQKARGNRSLTFFSPPGRWPDCGSACKKSRKIPMPQNHAIDYCDTTTSGYKTHYPFFVHTMLASAELHAQLGWELHFLDDPFSADIVVCSHSKAEQFLDDPRRTRRQLVIAVETGDSAHVLTPPNVLSRPEVLAAVKHHSWRFPLQVCKEPVKEAILQGLALRESPADSGFGSMTPGKVAQLLADQGCQAIPDESFRKVHTSIPSWLTVQKGPSWLEKHKHMRPIAERQVDVTFIGAVNGNFRKVHRAGLVAALKAIKQKSAKWKFYISSSHHSEAAYTKALSSTKLFISPWGYGEWSGKDEEAILGGAVLLKPLASCMDHLMPMYASNVTCLDVRPDWRNLEAVIAGALGDLERLQRIQEAALGALRPYMGYNQAFRSSAAAFARLLANATSIAKDEFAKPWTAQGHREG